MHLSRIKKQSCSSAGVIALLLALLPAVFLASALTVVSAGSASAETRTLRMYYGHSKESATITFKKNGRYVKSGLRKMNRFLRDWRRKEATRMDPELLDLVWEVYRASGSRKPIQVISGYRSPKTNNMLRRRGRKVAKTSQHTRGKALDFYMPDVSVKKLRALGLKAHRGGVGYYRGSFVHLDTGSVRHWPRMSRRQLSRVFPRGKTIHVPSDGRPLKGYKTAMANLKRGLNANGTKRSTGVNRSLLARIFTPSNATDDDDAGAARKPAVARAAPAKPKPKPAPKKREPKKDPVLVAKGPDPFRVESSAVSQAERQKAERERIAQAKAEAESRAAKELAERAAEDVTSVAALDTSRIAVPRRRPAREPAQAETQLALAPVDEGAVNTNNLKPATLSPVGATELALATPEALSPATSAAALRPSVDVPNAPPTPKPADKQQVEALKTRITAALSQQKRVQTGNSTFPTAIPTPTAPQFRPTLADRLVAKADSKAALAPPIQQASLAPENQPVSSPSWRADRPNTTTDKKVSVSVDANSVPVPKAKPADATVQSTSLQSTGAPTPMVAELALGDLDGRTVTAWAVAVSTRVGPVVSLKAPVYRQGTRRAAPASVYSAGFAFDRAPLRADRFTGRALTRVAFAHFGTRN